MKIEQLIEENPTINITINASDLLEFGNTIASNTAREIIESREDKLYTREEAIEIFNVSAATIWRWVKVGIIKSKRVGKRVYFPESEIRRLTTLKTA